MAASGKVTVAMAAAIRKDAAAGLPYTKLAAKYGVHRMTVSRVARGVTAADAPGALVTTRNVYKLRCINGHLLSENRPVATKGCRSCNRDRNRRRRAAIRAAQQEMTSL